MQKMRLQSMLIRTTKGGSQIATPFGTKTMTVINETSLYASILSSKLPDDKKFKRWVTADALPAIRQTN